MNFTDLIAQVINLTARPDLDLVTNGGDGRIPNAIFASTLAMHTLEFFWKDVQSVDVVFDAPAYIQTLDIGAIPRFRAISYFRKWDPSYAAAQLNPTILPPLFNGTSIINQTLALKPLEIIDTGGIMDTYGTERQDVCYAAGSTIFIKSSTNMAQGKLGYYAYPFLDIPNVGTGYSSWVATDHPWAIIYHAASAIFATTGDLEASRELVRPSNLRTNDVGGLATQAINALKMSNIEVSGR